MEGAKFIQMSKTHTNANTLEKLIKIAHTPRGRIFRNNVGTGYQGKSLRLDNGDVLIKHPRLINFGLKKGSSDLIGWTTIEITPDMVGQKVAVFTAVELKTKNDTSSPEQRNFVEQVHKAGGLAGIVYNEEEYKKIFENFCK